MDTLLNHPWVHPIWHFIQSHPLLWFILFLVLLVGLGINWLANLIPQIDILKSQILLPWARRSRQKRLIKSAIKSDIRGHVNKEIGRMKKFLPDGWAGEMDIEWVDNEEPNLFKDDKRMVVRIRPVDNQDRNFVNATYYYLRSSFFPKTQAVIPKPHYEASVLHVARRIAESRNEETKIIFEDEVLEPAIERHRQIPKNLEDYDYLDTRGFFTGTFLRELHLMATDARFTSARGDMAQETAGVISHIKNFMSGYEAVQAGTSEEIPEGDWYNNSSLSKYSILLVAKPLKTKMGIGPYLNRARKCFEIGSKRLYVFGSNKEKDFANSVISGIENTIDNIHLVEKFETPFDYRENRNGIGAVFEVDR